MHLIRLFNYYTVGPSTDSGELPTSIKTRHTKEVNKMNAKLCIVSTCVYLVPHNWLWNIQPTPLDYLALLGRVVLLSTSVIHSFKKM